MSQVQHSGHRERLRSRFLQTGAKGFQQHELLELLLFYALPRINTNNIAHSLIESFGSLPEVLEADISCLSSVKGINSSSAAFISLFGDLCRYCSDSCHKPVKLSSVRKVREYFLNYFSSVSSEMYLILSISPSNDLLNVHSFTISEFSSISGAARKIAEISVRNNIRRIIIGHNQPEQPPMPQEKDYELTRIFSETLSPLGIEVCDHIICGCGKAFSMHENGAYSFI